MKKKNLNKEEAKIIFLLYFQHQKRPANLRTELVRLLPTVDQHSQMPSERPQTRRELPGERGLQPGQRKLRRPNRPDSHTPVRHHARIPRQKERHHGLESARPSGAHSYQHSRHKPANRPEGQSPQSNHSAQFCGLLAKAHTQSDTRL